MLKSILSGEDCAKCRFCCTFRRQSLWETPVFDRKTKEILEKKFPEAKFRQITEKSFTPDLLHLYKTEDSEEEAPCPFLGDKGCLLDSDEKPFDCSIWPLRSTKIDGRIRVMLENTCPAINRQPLENVIRLVVSGLGEKITAYAKENPDTIKDFSPDYKIVF